MHQAILLSLSPTVLYRLIGINRRLNRELFQEYLWKKKVERDIDPPYHRQIPCYRQYYLVRNKREYGKLWNGKERVGEYDRVSKLFPGPAFINDDMLFVGSGQTPRKKRIKDYFYLGDCYLDLDNKLRRFDGDEVIAESVNCYLYLPPDGGLILKLNGDVIFRDENQSGIVVATGIIQLHDTPGFVLGLDEFGNHHRYNRQKMSFEATKLENIMAITGNFSETYSLTFDGAIYGRREGATKSINFPIPIRKAIHCSGYRIMIGCDGRGYLHLKHPPKAVGAIELGYQHLIDYLPDYDLAIAKNYRIDSSSS